MLILMILRLILHISLAHVLTLSKRLSLGQLKSQTIRIILKYFLHDCYINESSGNIEMLLIHWRNIILISSLFDLRLGS